MKTKKSLRVSIIGTGNIATHLARAIAYSDFDLVHIVSRDILRAKALAQEVSAQGIDQLSLLESNCDIVILAVKDEALKAELLHQIPKDIIICHSSGTVGINILNTHARQGVFYPLQTFSKQKSVDFRSVPICLEANSKEVFNVLNTLAQTISTKVFAVNSEQRKALHIAAVFASNFTNLMYDISEKLCHEAGLDFDILRPLISETADKVQEYLPHEVQTGPAVRNDSKTIESHLKALNKHPDYQKIYRLLTQEIIQNNEEL